jgi:dTDP-4-amino-4,6-dideoxygalactose transaminase
LEKHLNESGIGTIVHYPIPPHLSGAYIGNKWQPGSFPITEQMSEEVLSIPMAFHMTNEQVQAVIETLTEGV